MAIPSPVVRAGKRLLRALRKLRHTRLAGRIEVATDDLVAGWVRDRANPGRAVALDVVHGEAIIAKGRAAWTRPDLGADGEGLCGFRIPLPEGYAFGADDRIDLRDARTGRSIPGSPVRVAPNPVIAGFRERAADPARRARLLRRSARPGAVSFSVVMPVYDPPEAWLVEAIESVLGQWHARWELICVDDGSRAPHVGETLRRYAARDGRITLVRTDGNRGIAAATNRGIAAATGDFIAFMDHDDVLEPDALGAMAEACRAEGVDLAYSDEILTGEDSGHFIRFVARPAFSHDYYLTHPYFVHCVACRRSLVEAVGGLDETLPVSQDVDFILRILERARRVAHVPRFLYRWRTHSGSAGHTKMDRVSAITREAIAGSLARLRPGARVEPGPVFNTYRILWPPAPGRTLIVVPGGGGEEGGEVEGGEVEGEAGGGGAARRRLAASIARHTEPGAFVLTDEPEAPAGRDCAFVLFLDDACEILSDGWLDRLRSLAARPEVGAVGPLQVSPDGLVRHGGVILGFDGAAGPAFARTPASVGGSRNPGYNAALAATRDVSALSAACLMMRRAVFDEAGGWDGVPGTDLAAADLCLRIAAKGYRILCDGDLIVGCRADGPPACSGDAAAFADRWRERLSRGDPFYSPMLQPEGTDHLLRRTWPEARQLKPRIRSAGLAPPGWAGDSPIGPTAE